MPTFTLTVTDADLHLFTEAIDAMDSLWRYCDADYSSQAHKMDPPRWPQLVLASRLLTTIEAAVRQGTGEFAPPPAGDLEDTTDVDASDARDAGKPSDPSG